MGSDAGAKESAVFSSIGSPFSNDHLSSRPIWSPTALSPSAGPGKTSAGPPVFFLDDAQATAPFMPDSFTFHGGCDKGSLNGNTRSRPLSAFKRRHGSPTSGLQSSDDDTASQGSPGSQGSEELQQFSALHVTEAWAQLSVSDHDSPGASSKVQPQITKPQPHVGVRQIGRFCVSELNMADMDMDMDVMVDTTVIEH